MNLSSFAIVRKKQEAGRFIKILTCPSSVALVRRIRHFVGRLLVEKEDPK